jgi:hypothetical protein
MFCPHSLGYFHSTLFIRQYTTIQQTSDQVPSLRDPICIEWCNTKEMMHFARFVVVDLAHGPCASVKQLADQFMAALTLHLD